MRSKALVSAALTLVFLAAGACVGEDPDPKTPAALPDAAPPTTSPPTTTPASDGGPAPVDPRCPACALGCDDTNACFRAIPSTAAGGDDLPDGGADLKLSAAAGIELDTTTGEIREANDGGILRQGDLDAGAGTVRANIGYVVKPQDGGPELAVFTVRSLTLDENVKATFKGKYAPVIVASGDITINGTLSARQNDCKPVGGALGGYGTPGGFGGVQTLPSLADMNGPTGEAPDPESQQPKCSGGGGGGNESNGGRSGNATFLGGTTNAAAGGKLRPASLLDAPVLYAGGRGGNGGQRGSNASQSPGGMGGGALELVSNGSIIVNGLVDAGGCGGFGGKTGAGACSGGGGGGAGGTVLLEAVTVRVTAKGKILANGGGGGGGTSNPAPPSTDGTVADKGEDGSLVSKEPAKGGPGLGNCPPGGSGAAVSSDVANAAGKCEIPSNSNTGVGGGGGGGASGHIVARTRSKAIDVEAGGLVFPAASVGEIKKQ